MLNSSSFDIFNPTTIQCDEHASAKIGLKDVYGEDFVENRTSVCEYLKPRTIVTGDLHFFVEGLLHLEDRDRVVETKLRFCINSRCVRDIKSCLNNIRSIGADTIIRIDPALNGITQTELNTIKSNSIKVENIENVEILPN